MAGRQTRWGLEDVVDFEALLAREEGAAVPGGEERRVVREAVVGGGDASRSRRRGLRAWLEFWRGRESLEAGRRTVDSLRLVGILGGIVVLLAGVGLVRGLLEVGEGGQRVFNIWLLLGVTVGLQWLVLLGSGLGYLLVRRQSGALSLGPRLAGVLVQRVAGKMNPALWPHLLDRGRGYGSVLGWRLARMTQGWAVLFNLGLLAGFLSHLWVLKVGFFWESTLFAPQSIQRFAEFLSWPWKWTGQALPPPLAEQDYDLLQKRFYEVGGGEQWWPYLVMVIAVWGLLPRLALWMLCWIKGRGALGAIRFQEVRHRELWRALGGVRREPVTEGPADGVVLVDVGGSGVETAALREFLLREMRVHPEERYEAAVLDGTRETEAWEAIRKAPLGVVFLVEGWALSPKQMDAIYRTVRAHGADRTLRFLVLGAVREGQPGPPEQEQLHQWERYVDGLKDPAAEAIGYREPAALPGAEGGAR